MKITKVMLAVAGAGVLLAGCSSTPVAPPAQPQPEPAKPPVVQQPYVAPKPMAIPEYLDPNSPISQQRSVYFDFDKYVVKDQYKGLVELQGKYLANHPSVNIKVEGNADERGTSEYNLALGQKRAEAVRAALKVFGANDNQMEAVSFGKEKPKAAGHDEAAWAENRRADIQYPSK